MATYGVDFDPLPKRIHRFLRGEIAPYLRARNKKPLHQQIREMIAIYREYRFLPYHYFTHNLYRKCHSGEILDYLPADMLIMFCSSLNPVEGIEAALDKTSFGRKMRDAGLPVVGDICTLREDGDIRIPDGTALNFQQFIDLLQSQCQEAFFKLRRGACGLDARKFTVDDIRTMGWDGLRTHLYGRSNLDSGAEFIVQRVIVQHPTLASVSPTSVSTVRIDTYADGEGIHFNTAVLRVGSGNICTDNWATGGLIIKVDIESGKLIGNGKRDAKFGKREFSEHPVTGTRFDDVQLPYWTELKALVRSAARQMLPLRSIGWDVTITPDGPLLIEANHDYDKFLSQQGGGGYRHLPLGQALMRQIHRSPGQRPSERGKVLANP